MFCYRTWRRDSLTCVDRHCHTHTPQNNWYTHGHAHTYVYVCRRRNWKLQDDLDQTHTSTDIITLYILLCTVTVSGTGWLANGQNGVRIVNKTTPYSFPTTRHPCIKLMAAINNTPTPYHISPHGRETHPPRCLRHVACPADPIWSRSDVRLCG